MNSKLCQACTSAQTPWDTGFDGALVIRSTAIVCETELAKVAKTPATIRSPFWTRDLLDQAELLELREVGPEACVGWLVT